MTSSQPEYNLLSAWHDLPQDLRPGVGVFSPPVNGPKSRIALFACYPHWTAVCLAMSLVLVNLGHEVDLLWQPEIDSNRPATDEEKKTMIQAMADSGLPNLRPYLNLIDLSQVPASELGIKAMEESVLASFYDTVYVRRTTKVDLTSPGDNAINTHWLKRNMSLRSRLATVISNRKYDMFLIPNGGIQEFGAAFAQGVDQGLSCISFEMGSAMNEKVLVSKQMPFAHLNTQNAWAANPEHSLTKEQGRKISNLINDLDGETYWQTTFRRLQRTAKQSPVELMRRLNLEPGRRIALLCPNTGWDSTSLHRDTIFGSIKDWVVSTVNFFARHPEHDLIIRVHPAEAMSKSEEKVAEYLGRRFDPLPKNIHIVESSSDINTYGLMYLADLGLAYTSTTGLEMPIRGLPTIVAARGHYSGKGFTIDPKTRRDYFDSLEKALTQPDKPSISRRESELAWRYAYLFFVEMRLDFPWACGRMREKLGVWPITEVLSQNGMEKFGQTFKILTGEIPSRPGLVANPGSREARK